MRSTSVCGPSEVIFTLHTRHHYLFRHVEMELFVPKVHSGDAVKFIQEAIRFFAGLSDVVSEELTAALASVGLLQEYQALQGSYVHHYLIFFRRVLGRKRTSP